MEHSSFVPQIFACTGGAAPGSTKTVRKIAKKTKRKLVRIILGHNKFYQNKNKSCTSEECNPLTLGVRKTYAKNASNIDNFISAIIEKGRFYFTILGCIKSDFFIHKILPMFYITLVRPYPTCAFTVA